ncbi:MAG TPA: Gfo/Idh/MocA family oxidoreductase [Candidatus Bathyarchaeia archaeon]|jgi:predicted dehydrogenase|nr:Gfo/Idh/MocA family oxidoreductase [Candidatus Bathyarchaeia archaeon]
MRIGLAGLGIHGGRYAAHLLAGEVPGAALGAISRADAREGSLFALARGIAYVNDPRELATVPGIDAVVVCLPPDLHPDVAIACLEAGRPVLVEKPLAATVEAAGRVVETARRTGTPIMVAHTMRFDGVVLAMRREAVSLGRLRAVAINQRFEPTRRPWIDTPGRGGMLLNTGVHAFDLLRFLTGSEIVEARALLTRTVTRDTEDGFAATLRLEPGGILATVDNARTVSARSGRIEIAGERGQLRGDHIHRELWRMEGTALRDLGPVPRTPTVPATLAAFTHALSTGAPMPVTVEDGLAAVRVACALRLTGAMDPADDPRPL